MTHIELQNQLETLIDNTNLSMVLDQLAQICLVKSDHIASNWQDARLARAWEQAGNRLLVFKVKLDPSI